MDETQGSLWRSSCLLGETEVQRESQVTVMEQDTGTVRASRLEDQGWLPGGSGTQAEAGIRVGHRELEWRGIVEGNGSGFLADEQQGQSCHGNHMVCVEMWGASQEPGPHAVPCLWGATSLGIAPHSRVTTHPWSKWMLFVSVRCK